MNRGKTIAALAVIGAGSVTVAPSFAQDPSGARMATERAPVSSGMTSGALPSRSVQFGTKRKATSQEGPELQSQKAVRPLSLSPGAAPNLPVR